MVFSGLLIQMCYHMGHQGRIDSSKITLGFNYSTWSDVHKISIAVVSILMILHFHLHWSWYKTVLQKKRIVKNVQVITLTLIFLVVAITGMIPWTIHLTGGSEGVRKNVIEIHDKLAIVLFIYLLLHVQKRFRWFTRLNPFHLSSRQTPFIQLDTRKCVACWKCVDLCPNNVLGRVKLPGHKHVRIENESSCAGCLECVHGCETKALTVRG
jgi:2-oxoglutarate ferredoxin oxidoreductase subunit delta